MDTTAIISSFLAPSISTTTTVSSPEVKQDTTTGGKWVVKKKHEQEEKKVVQIPVPDLFVPTVSENLVSEFQVRVLDRELPVVPLLVKLAKSFSNVLHSFTFLDDYAQNFDVLVLDKIREIKKKTWIPEGGLVMHAWNANPADADGHIRDVSKLADRYSKKQQMSCIYRMYSVQGIDGVIQHKIVNMSLFFNVKPYFDGLTQCTVDQVRAVAKNQSTLNVNQFHLAVFENTCEMVADYWLSNAQRMEQNFHESAPQIIDELISMVIGMQTMVSRLNS